MPRRKGHGIPPTKRVKLPEAISRSAPLKNKLYNEIPVVREEPIQMTIPIKSDPPSIINDVQDSKYLHKKFKKRAFPFIPEDTINHNNLINRNHFQLTNSEASNQGGRYVCSYCNMNCNKPSVLEKHIRAHTNERPYPCKPCGFAFKTKSNLYKHRRSRTHATKLEETGEKGTLCDGDESPTSEDDDNSSSNISNTTTQRSDNDSEMKEDAPKSIYKPKYRFMEQSMKSNEVEKSDERKENTQSPNPRLLIKIPTPNSSTTVSTPSPFTSGSSPSPEFIHRHINKLINDNKAIVETNDPFWTKKILHKTNSSENASSSCPQSLSPLPGDSNLFKWSSKFAMMAADSSVEANCDKSSMKPSKLALALLRPQAPDPSPQELDTSDVQPLNLSTTNKEQCFSALNRKRSYSEGFPERSQKQLKDRINNPVNNHNSITDFRRLIPSHPLNSPAAVLMQDDINKEVAGSLQNPEGSIIKDLLLKTRVSPCSGSSSEAKSVSLTPPECDRQDYLATSQLCSTTQVFSTDEDLEERYHCGDESSLKSSTHRDLHVTTSSNSLTCTNQTPIPIEYSYPPLNRWRSPGPRLGNTQLVERSDPKSVLLKKRRFCNEELPKNPLSSNLQMFGEEGKVLDSPVGEAKPPTLLPKEKSLLFVRYSGSMKDVNSLNKSGQNGDEPIEVGITLASLLANHTSFNPKVVKPRISAISSAIKHLQKSNASFLTDSTVINPLTSITGYNPLTLPPSGDINTIFYGGKEIPYVPGMPGPQTLLENPLPLFPSMLDSKFNNSKESVVRNTNQTCLNIPSIQVDETFDTPSDASSSINKHKRSMEDIHTSPTKRSNRFSLSSETDLESPSPEKKFLRPTSLPLKTGTFVLKQQRSTPVLTLVSPETPRPRKSYGQLYLNGHAYTYLGLKCSTKTFYCTLNKPQPLYVPLSPEHNKVSMYSNWKVFTEADPNPFGLSPCHAMALYNSCHRPLTYTQAQTSNSEVVTHSSYFTNRSQLNSISNKEELSPDDDEAATDSVPKRFKIFQGGYESNEEYIYIRGRGRGRYVCEECGIRCKKPSMLKKHIRTHTDVRPYTCIHCKFSFKTKGNLTKHMKSKAHFKKCSDLNIIPVPTVVDDSYVNREALAQQQALREKQGVGSEESEEEDDEDDDSEEEEDDDDDEDEIEGDNCVEREAAQSLLTLSESQPCVKQRQQILAGLLPLRVRPSTYPYRFSSPLHPGSPNFSVQPDREKMLHNSNDMISEPMDVEEEYGFAHYSQFAFSKDLRDSDVESPAKGKDAIPMDLSNKSNEKSTRVCEGAMLLASLCSTMERLPVTTASTADSEDSKLLQTYLKEKAVQDTMMKKQYQHKPPVAATEAKAKIPSVNISAAKENALGILAQTSSDARKAPLSEHQVSVSKPQAEFLPPSSAPSPSYVSVLDDGRSRCNMCNKIFSKPSQLRLHVNIHYFERPFRCESCAVSFRTNGHLQKHQRSVSHLNKANMNQTFGTPTTTNPRPFKCDDCNIAFRIHGHLAKHLRSKMHIMKLECLGKLPFGTYAELERSGMNMNDIDTTDCENSLESLQLLAQKMYEKDPTKLGQWNPSDMMPQQSTGDSSSGEEDEDMPCPLPPSGPVISPVQRLPPPVIQKPSLSQSNIEPLKCVINICNSPVTHKDTSETEELVIDKRTEDSESTSAILTDVNK